MKNLKKNLKKNKVKAHRIMAGDVIEIGAKLFLVTDACPALYGSDRTHLQLCKINGDSHFDRASLFFNPTEKITVFSEK